MKTRAKLNILAIIAGISCFAFNAYTLYRFGWGWGATTTTMNEAGGFLGGVIGPILNFLTLIAVLATTSMQADELRISNETLSNTKEELSLSRSVTQKQFQHIEKEARKSEIMKVLDLLDLDLQKCLSRKVDNSRTLSVVLDDVNNSKNYETLVNDFRSRRPRMVIEELSSLLRRLNTLLKEYEYIESNSPVIFYYDLKYFTYASAMAQAKLVQRQDVDTLIGSS